MDRGGGEMSALAQRLRRDVAGDVRTDRLHRALYATDASIYQIVPDVVVMPRSVADVAATVRACAASRVPLTARGAGTGLTGGAINRGVQLDCSRHLNRILHIDPDAGTARVEPGVVLDELNAELAPYGLHFAPDVATSSRATLGGMIANNSCGAHSILYGRTVDHLLDVNVVLSDGSTCRWGRGDQTGDNPLARRCEEALAAVAGEHAAEITARYPNILRRNAGYGLDRLRVDEDGRGINPEAIVCGSEGTLCVVVEARLKLTPLPKHKGLVLVHFTGLSAALEATPAILDHHPAAVELIDKLVLDAARRHPAATREASFIQGDPQAILIVEFFDDNPTALADRLDALVSQMRTARMGYAWPVLADATQQANVWAVRRSGLGLLMSKPGSRQPYAFVEDTAVEPAKLRAYIARFGAILAEEGVRQAGYYAHASVGCLHVRPVLDLSRCEDVQRMRRIADRVSSLALEFGGTMTGEHGDGILRSCWLEKMYGPRIMQAFRKIKHAFDPHGILNPGKIVDPLPMTENLRTRVEEPRASARAALRKHDSLHPNEEPRASARAAPTTAKEPFDTVLDFSTHGGVAGLAGMCSGVGQCRQRQVGTMCPSYMATDDERHSTRGRANALRIALSDHGLLQGLDDPALAEVMDLCLSCKACKTECPTGVDMARLKSAWLAIRHRLRGVPVRSRLIAATAALAEWGSRFAPLTNWLLEAGWFRALLEHAVGLDRRLCLPLVAHETFRQWWQRRRAPHRGRTDLKEVVYFVDTWTNYTTPQVGIAAVKVLEALGCHVVVPPVSCCGRPAISQGLLWQAKRLAEENVTRLAAYARRGVPVIGTEPSCVSAMLDEWPQFVQTADARKIAEAATTLESFVAGALQEDANIFRPGVARRPVLYHGHCHQKALLGTTDAMCVLSACTGGRAAEINSGCCGMAGSFGHEVEHYEVARAVGEQRLFPAVRGRGDAAIAVSGFSCRQQIRHHTGASPRHVAELLAEALVSSNSEPPSQSEPRP